MHKTRRFRWRIGRAMAARVGWEAMLLVVSVLFILLTPPLQAESHADETTGFSTVVYPGRPVSNVIGLYEIRGSDSLVCLEQSGLIALYLDRTLTGGRLWGRLNLEYDEMVCAVHLDTAQKELVAAVGELENLRSHGSEEYHLLLVNLSDCTWKKIPMGRGRPRSLHGNPGKQDLYVQKRDGSIDHADIRFHYKVTSWEGGRADSVRQARPDLFSTQNTSTESDSFTAPFILPDGMGQAGQSMWFSYGDSVYRSIRTDGDSLRFTSPARSETTLLGDGSQEVSARMRNEPNKATAMIGQGDRFQPLRVLLDSIETPGTAGADERYNIDPQSLRVLNHERPLLFFYEHLPLFSLEGPEVTAVFRGPDNPLWWTAHADGSMRLWHDSLVVDRLRRIPPVRRSSNHSDFPSALAEAGVGEAGSMPGLRAWLTVFHRVASDSSAARVYHAATRMFPRPGPPLGPLFTLYRTRDDAWLAVTPEGFYTGSEERRRWVHTFLLREDRYLPLPRRERRFAPWMHRPKLLAATYRTGRPDGEEACTPCYLDLLAAAHSDRPSVTLQPTRPTADTLRMGVEIEAGAGGLAGWDLVTLSPVLGASAVFDTNRHGAVVSERFVMHGPVTHSETIPLSLMPGENRFFFRAMNLWKEASSAMMIEERRPPLYDNRNLHLLSVGVDEYSGATARLDYAVRDAERMRDHLELHGRAAYRKTIHYEQADRRATRAGILFALQRARVTMREEDLFVFFFAGHGMVEPSTGDLLLFPEGTNPERIEDRAPDVCIPGDTLAAWIAPLPARHRLLLLDACFSGNELGGWEQAARASGLYRQTAVLSAAGPEEYAREARDLQQGVFARSLTEALRGAADGTAGHGRDRWIDIEELARYVEKRVPALCDSLHLPPQTPRSQLPAGEFPVIGRAW
ncbi:hypothetical protein GF324_11760 [bacterium]|nr:hypothetical protein [bacterium]